MAILKKINFGNGAHDIAKTVVTAKSGGVMSVAAPSGVTNGENEQADYQYELDVNIDGTTLVKSTTGEGQQAVTKLAVGTVPAAQVSVADDGGKLTATNVEAALAELDDKITSTGNVAKKYKVVSVDSPAGTSLAEYKLQVAEGTSETYADVTGSANIVVPKDQHLKSVVLTNEDASGNEGSFMKFTYVLDNGNESDVYVNLSNFLTESEFGDGLSVSNAGAVSAKLGQGLEFGGESGENQSIKVKIDSTSEKDGQSTPADFLTVGANGVKIQGIGAEIDRKIAALDYTDTAVSGQYVTEVDETNGVISVSRANVSAAPLNDYAKGNAPAAGSEAVAATDTVNQAIAKLEHQVDAAKAAATSGITTAIEALDNTDTAEGGKVVTAVSTADGKAVPTKADFAGITLGGFTQDATATGAIADTDTLGAALNKLENGIDAAKQAAAAGHSAVAKDANANHLTLTESENTTTGQKTYTIGENNIASASDLTAEVTRAQNAEGEIAGLVGLGGTEGSRTFTSTTNYGGSSANVAANLQALDTALNTLSTKVGDISYSVSGTELTFYGIPQHQAQQGG